MFCTLDNFSFGQFSLLVFFTNMFICCLFWFLVYLLLLLSALTELVTHTYLVCLVDCYIFLLIYIGFAYLT